MSERPAPALVDALALLRSPRGPRLRAGERLPEGVLQLIRVVAGEEEALAGAAEASGEAPENVREAATFYIQQILFAPGSDSFRVLGVDSDAEDERIREHYRWLARWLHPDRNPDAWEVVFAERVNKAWQDLRTSERRQRYQQSADSAAAAVAAESAGSYRELPALPRRNAPEALPGKRMDLRWLPNAIFGSLAIIAVAGLLLIYAVRMADSRREASNAARAAAEAADATAPERTPVALVAPVVEPVVESASVESPPPPRPAPVSSPAPEPTPIIQASPVQANVAAAPIQPPPPKRAAALPVRVAPRSSPSTVAAQVSAPYPASAKVAPTVRSAKRAARPAPEAVAANVAKSDTPAPAPAAPHASAASAGKIGERDANRLLSHFSQAYEDGDITGMRAMFAADARGPRGGVDAILSDYNRVFESSTQRTLNVRDVSWFVTGDTLTIIASFEATVIKGRAGKARRSHGDLRLDLRRENDQWYIYRLQHDERPG